MAHQYFIDGFTKYTDLSREWDEAWRYWENGVWGLPHINPTGGRCGDGYLHLDSGQAGVKRSRDFGDQTKCVIGMAVNYEGNGENADLFLLMHGSDWGIWGRILANGALEILWGEKNSAVSLGVSASGLFRAGRWQQIQAKIVLDASTGSVDVRKDGNPTPILAVPNIDTVQGGADHADGYCIGVYKWSFHAGASRMVSDFWIDYGADADFRGDCRVATAFALAQGYYSDFDRSGGASNAECVDEHDPDDLGTYVYSANTGDKDTYTHTGIAVVGTATIHTVKVSPCAQKAFPGTAQMAVLIRSNGVDANGPTFSPAAGSFDYYPAYFDLDPDGNGAWLVSKLNALEIGQEVK